MNDHVVVFDIGRVLVDFDVARAIGNLCVATGAEAACVESALFEGAHYADYSCGRLDARAFFEAFAARCRGTTPLSLEAFDRAWCEMFTPMAEMDALAREVAARYPVLLCSNTDPLHYQFLLRTVPSLRLARGAVLSYEVGAEKPDPALYAAVSKLAGDVPKGRIVFIDDRADNILGARKAGFDAIQFAGASALRLALRARGLDVSER